MEKNFISYDNHLILKGGGIIMMLIHHLFTNELSGLYNDVTIFGFSLINQIGVFCKLCVALFVFVSGYGLMSSYKKYNLKSFYFHRFKKLYLNYWFIYILFVPVSVFVFGISFSDAYGDHVVGKAVLEFLGVLNVLGGYGYNPTWWFQSCIIILYLLFPLLHRWLTKIPFLLLTISVTLMLFSFIPGVNCIRPYLLPFITGMAMATFPVRFFDKRMVWEIVVALILLSLGRLSPKAPKFVIDTLLCVGLSVLLYKIELKGWLRMILKEFGKHSMNIYMFHTFIFAMWFEKIIYISRNPLLIFLELMFSCYVLSVLIEWLKNKIGFYKLLK